MTASTPFQRTATSLLAAILLLGCDSSSDGDTSSTGDGGVSLPDHDGGTSPEDPEPEDPGEPSEPGSPAEVAHWFMPTGDPANTRAPKLALDADGNLHAVYPAYAGGDAYYALCEDGCAEPDAMQAVRLPTDGTVLDAMIALTETGAPRVLLSTALDVTWAQCDEDCGNPESWLTSVILEHGGDREVSGNALALDAQGRPRFVMHTYLALLGIGQKPPQTFYAQCDDDCLDPSSWRIDAIQDQIWQGSQLSFDADGRAHLATVAVTLDTGGPIARQGAYVVCDSGCSSPESWSGIVLMDAYESYTEELAPAIALTLTKEGAPRIAVLGKLEDGGKGLAYFECDADCDQDHWRFALISAQEQLGSGVDIAVDPEAHPRIAFTLAHNVGVYHCELSDCTGEGVTWDLGKVEFATDLAKDDIILWPNCTVDAWSLHDPALALASNGDAFVGYEATDLSGGGAYTQDPTKPPCLAGKDMTLSRVARIPRSAQ